LLRVSERLKGVIKELDADEAAGLTSALQFKNLPPLEKWPAPVVAIELGAVALDPEDGDLLGIEEKTPNTPGRRNRLRYHTRVIVDRTKAGSES